MDRYRGFDINTLRQQMEDLFDDFFPSSARKPSGNRPPEQDASQPLPLNILETETEVIVLAPLAGLTPEDVDITVRGQTLTIKAQRRDPYPERRDYLRREWGYGPFQRNVELSFPVDADHAQARFKNGVVTLTLPKADSMRPRKIELDSEEQQAAPAVEAEPETPETGENSTQTDSFVFSEPVDTEPETPTFDASDDVSPEPVEDTEDATAEQPIDTQETVDVPVEPEEEAPAPPARREHGSRNRRGGYNR